MASPRSWSSFDQTRTVIESFLEERAGYWLAEDVECIDWATAEPIRSRAATMARLRRRWPVGDARAVVGEGVAAVESEMDGARAAAFLEVRGGEIVRVRLYCGGSR